MPTTTLGSSMPNSVIELHVPPQWQDQLIADLDRLQAQDTADTSAVHAVVGKKNRAGYSAKLRAAITAMAARHRLQLSGWTGTANARNLWLQGQIKFSMKKRESAVKGLKKLPSLWLINDVLKTMKF